MLISSMKQLCCHLNLRPYLMILLNKKIVLPRHQSSGVAYQVWPLPKNIYD